MYSPLFIYLPVQIKISPIDSFLTKVYTPKKSQKSFNIGIKMPVNLTAYFNIYIQENQKIQGQ